MGANAKTIQVTLKTVADIKDVTNNVAQLQKALSGLSLSKGLEGQFTKLFTNVERNAEKASTVFAAGFKSKGDVTAYEKATNLIVEDMKKISQLMGQIDTSKLNFEIDTSKSKALVDDIKRLKQEIDTIRTQNLTELQKLVNNKPSGAKAWDDFFTAFQRGDEGIEDAEKALKRLQTQVDNAKAARKDFSDGSQWDKYQKGVTVCANALQILKGETGEAAVKQAELNQKTQELNTLQQQANNSGAAWLQGLLTNLTKVNGEAETYIRNTQKSAASTQQLGSELDQFKSRIAYFFGLNNAIALFQRALRSAYSTVKELDAVMTEMAVVTDFDLGDIWNQLPEYTARANELGVAISDAYESMTIFYQQGLKTDSALALSNETLKMARIAGLDAAEATDRMTNALRGFNMELNETNAQRVDDVYNKLAAISASNVDEISTAMTKVASLANNANMEFETTSAFLAQMIETTRESAETAGTALKTVIARFSEVKELYDQGELLGTDSEGEAIDVNKVSTALRSAGINLNEYLTGMKGLDDIFIELAQKWDSLDIVQQRYIATMAAGSRQQSRFIAMMSDYDRTMELVNAANNSAGAANEMFEKTLDSLETKVNKLKNAWNEFVMAIADNNLIKGAVDALTGLLNLINKLTGNSGIAKIGVTFAGLKLGKSLFNKLLGNIGAVFNNAGKEGGKSFVAGLSNTINTKFKVKDINIGLGQSRLLADEFISLKLSAQQAAQEFGATSEQALALEAQADAVRIKMNQLAAAYHSAATGTQTLTYEQQLTLASQIKEGVVTQEQINLMGAKLAARYADAIAIGDEATAQKILNEAKAREIALSKPGIVSLLTMIGLTAMHTAEKTGEAKVTWANVKAKIAETVVQLGLNKAMLVGLSIVGLIIAAVVILIALITLIVKLIKNSTPEAKLEAAKEAADDAAEAAQNAADAFTNLSDSWDSLSDKYKALEDMTRGSQEWRDAVREINAEVLELMDKYDGLKVEMKDGVLHITNMEDVLAEYEETSTKASSAAIAAKQTVIEAQNNVDRKDARSNFVKDTGGSYSLFDSNDDAFDAFAIALSKGKILPDEDGNYVDAAERWTRKYEDEHNLAQGSLGQFTDALNDAIPGLTKFGDGLRQADGQMEDYYTALSANAISMAKVDEDKADYATTFMSDKRMKEIVSQEEEKIGNVTGKNRDDLREKYAEGMGYANYAEYKKDHDDEDISDEQLKTQLAAMNAQDTATEQIKIFTENIEKASPELKKMYEAANGEALNKDDLIKLAGANYKGLIGDALTGEELLDENGKLTEDLQSRATELFKEIYGTPPDEESSEWKNFLLDFTNAIVSANNAFANSDAIFNKKSVKGTEGLSSNQSSQLASQIAPMAQQDAQAYIDAFNQVIGDSKLSDGDKENLLNQILATDPKNINQLQNVKDLMEELGIDKSNIDEFWAAATNGAKTYIGTLAEATNYTDQIHEKGNNANEIEDRLVKGEATSEDIATLEAAGVDLTGLERTAEGWKLTEEAAKSATDTIRQGLIEDAQKALEAQIATQQYYDTLANQYQYMLGSAIKDENGEYKAFDQNSMKDQAYILMGGTASSLGMNEADYWAQAEQKYNDYVNSRINGQQTLDALQSEVDYQRATKMTAAENEASFGSAESVNYSAQNEIANLGGDVEQFNQYVSAIKSANAELTDMQATMIALGNTKLNMGLSEIIDSYDEWTGLIDESTGLLKASTSDDIAVINKLKKSVNIMLNTTEDLSDGFWTSAKNMENLKKAAEGDTEALEALQKAASIDYLKNLDLGANVGDNVAEAENAISDFADYLSEINLPDLAPNVDMSDVWAGAGDFIEAFNQMASKANLTAEQIQSAVRSMGYDARIDYIEDTRNIPTEYTERVVDERDEKTGEATKWHTVTYQGESVPIKGYFPVVKTLTSTGSGGGGVSISNKSGGAANAKKASGGGGGDSSEKPSYWENPYDELYNLQEKINESLRTREALERRYQKLLNKTSSSLSEIRKAYYDQIKQLRAEADLQQAIAKGRKRQLNNIANETYTDSEGVQRSFASMGVTKYASYNASTGVITIDWAGLEAISRDAKREEEGKAAEAYINRLQELVEGYEEIRDELWEIEDKIEELRDEVVESYLDFEDRVMEAVVNEYQKQIDAFQAMSDEISNTTSKVLDSIKEEIDLTRQIRDNTKTEEEISDMENRLAYLRRDTSGANDLEIMQLEKDLEDARQNYTDTLIDQALDQMQKDADLAAEQRAQQQETLQNQLDIMKENGSLWDQVYTLIRNAEGSDGSFSKNSELVKLLKSNEGFNNLSNIGKAKWWEEASAAYKAAMVGKNEAEDKYGVDADNNGVVAKTGTQKAMNNVSNKSASVTPASTSSTKSTRTNKEKYGVALAVLNGGYGWGSGATRKKNLEAKGFNYNEIQGIINKLVAEGKVNSGAWVGAYYGIRNLSPYAMSKFKSGGLADFTGPAWLDGTKSHPELVLDATDSQNFITLKNILAQLLNGQGAGVIGSGGGDNYFDIDISAELGSDYDVDQLAERIKKQIYDNGTYRNVNTMNYLR